MPAKKPVVTICSSADFYRKAVDMQLQLGEHGYKAIVPLTAEKMKSSGDYDASHYRTWHKDANDYHKKTQLMRQHLAEVEKGDVVLVVNETKHGQANYIGGNVLIEMALAFYLHKPIYVWNDIPIDSSYTEEIIGMGSVPLHGKLDTLLHTLGKLHKPTV